MRAVCNLSTPKYYAGQKRLIASIPENIDCIWCESDEEYTGDKMYTFKPETIQHTRDKSYTSILWLDASMIAIKDISPIFDHIEKHGYFFQDSEWLNKQWTNARAKEYFGTDEGRMLSSGVLGLDFTNSVACQFFDEWKRAADDGIFNGSHKDHRHDQTAASIIAHKLGMNLTPNNSLWNYGKEPFHNDILILADGIS